MSLQSGGNLYPSRFVMADANNSYIGLQATAGAGILGISREDTRTSQPDSSSIDYHAISGDSIGLHTDPEQTCLLTIADTVSHGDRLKSDADGKGVPVDTTSGGNQEYGAVAAQAGVSGDRIKVYPRPNGFYAS